MFYGFKSLGVEKDQILLDRLRPAVRELWDTGTEEAYLELDGPYGGVAVRKLSRYSDEDLDRFVEKAEKVYTEVK